MALITFFSAHSLCTHGLLVYRFTLKRELSMVRQSLNRKRATPIRNAFRHRVRLLRFEAEMTQESWLKKLSFIHLRWIG